VTAIGAVTLKVIMKKQFKALTDGFVNIVKGLGTKKDARSYNRYVRGFRITEQVANDLYVYNSLAAKIVDAPIDDATRKWRTLLIPDADKKQEVEKVINEFEVKEKINIASKWARIFGGAVIIAIIDGEDLASPLDIERIRPNSLKNFIVLDRYKLYSSIADDNTLSENFGKPEYYMVSERGQPIHYTRLTKFDGVIPTIREYRENDSWGISIYTKLWEDIANAQNTFNSICNLVFEANMDVYRIKGLNQLVAQRQDNLVLDRLKILHQMKSILNGIVLDQEDEYDKKTVDFSQLAQIDDRSIQKVSAASDIPVTRLVGISPAGMNSTGESDLNNYYDGVQSVQENKLRPKIEWMDSIIMASHFQTTEVLDWEFKPLKQLTEIEQASVDLSNAQRDQIYLNQNVIQPTDVMAQLAENGTYVKIDENRVEKEIKEEEELNFTEGLEEEEETEEEMKEEEITESNGEEKEEKEEKEE
jgi:hypothetical protein